MGVMATEGYRSAKNRFVEDPSIENNSDRTHIRGVLIERVVSSVGDTEARTASCGLFSSSSDSVSEPLPETLEASSPIIYEDVEARRDGLSLTPSSKSPSRGASARLKRPSRPEASTEPSISSDMRDDVDGRDLDKLLLACLRDDVRERVFSSENALLVDFRRRPDAFRALCCGTGDVARGVASREP